LRPVMDGAPLFTREMLIMKTLKWVLCLAALGGAFVTATPDADAARRASLAGNRLILDKNDVLFFPQLSVNYANLLSADLGTTGSAGAGLAILGNESMAFGVGVARGDIFDTPFFPHTTGHPQLGGVPNLLGGRGLPAPHTMFDVFAGMELGPGLVGARIALGTGGFTDDPADRNSDLSTSNHTFVLANLGFSLTGDFRLDTGLSILVSSGRAEEGRDNEEAGTIFGLAFGGRGYTPLAQGVDLGFIADLNFASDRYTVYRPSPGLDANETNFGFVAGAGPVYDIGGVTTLAGYAVVGIAAGSEDPDWDGDYDESSYTTFILPGLQLAADIHLFDWLYFRTGMQYLFAFQSTAEATDNGDDYIRTRGSNFGWRAGVGINLGNFTLDGAFTSGFLTSGPSFVGGQAPGLFTMVNAQYRF
jgi:hypothetical protein